MLHYMILNDPNGSMNIREMLERLRPSLSFSFVQEGDNGECLIIEIGGFMAHNAPK